MKAPLVKPVRCAIYTRVSTDAASTNCYGSQDVSAALFHLSR